NYVIPEDPAVVFAEGRQHKVDVLMGANAAELPFGGRRGPAGASDGSDRILWTAWRIAQYQRAAGQDAYVYWFTQTSPAPEGSEPYLLVHAVEVKYVFDNLGERPLFPDSSAPALGAASSADQRVADMVASYWVNRCQRRPPSRRLHYSAQGVRGGFRSAPRDPCRGGICNCIQFSVIIGRWTR